MFAKKVAIRFAGIRMGFDFPSEIEVPKAFLPFVDENTEDVNVEYRIVLLDKPLEIHGEPVGRYNSLCEYEYENGWLRNYVPLTAKDGCQLACYLARDGRNTLYYPKSRWEHYKKELHCLHLIGIEKVLLSYDAFLLHSSLVEMNGKTILFSGPSGAGKSTQAFLWEKYKDAKVLNGDRCIVRKMDGRFIGCGSPWAGTSGIYSQRMAPIGGIILLSQSERNSIRQVKKEAFLRLYEQSIVNGWDTDFVQQMTALLSEVINEVPIYELKCMPNEEAVQMAYEMLFEGGMMG